MTMAVFTRDLRVQDNSVLTAAHRQGTAVAPVFVLDATILGGSYLTANKAAFLSMALNELDEELRRRGGRLIVRRGQFAVEVKRLVDELSITDVHIAADVSAYSQHRKERLRVALPRDRCRVHVHAGTITVVEPGGVTPDGRDYFAVFTPYYRHWLNTRPEMCCGAPRRWQCLTFTASRCRRPPIFVRVSPRRTLRSVARPRAELC
jgi:deoxyribodipyrimidine photo-lyase